MVLQGEYESLHSTVAATLRPGGFNTASHNNSDDADDDDGVVADDNGVVDDASIAEDHDTDNNHKVKKRPIKNHNDAFTVHSIIVTDAILEWWR